MTFSIERSSVVLAASVVLLLDCLLFFSFSIASYILLDSLELLALISSTHLSSKSSYFP
jgi:hypothetical protein